MLFCSPQRRSGPGICGLLLLLLAWGGMTLPAQRQTLREASADPSIPLTAQLSLAFEANQGQSHKDVRFLSRHSGYSLFLTTEDTVFVLHDREHDESATSTTSVLTLQFADADTPEPVGKDLLPGMSHYFVGTDTAQWHTDIARYARVQRRAVWPGIDAIYHSQGGELKLDFVLAPGADPKAVQLTYTGADGLSIDAEGALLVATRSGHVVHAVPFVYQDIRGAVHEIASAYVLLGETRVGIAVGAYDPTYPLIVDPTISFHPVSTSTAVVGRQLSHAVPYASTSLGGSSGDQAEDIAVDRAGNVYIVGTTASDDFPATGTPSPDETMAFVAKLSGDLSTVFYATYLGGEWHDRGRGIAVTHDGSAVVTGWTHSHQFPVVPVGTALQGQRGAVDSDAFVTRLTPAGNGLLYSTYLGGDFFDVGHAVAVDVAGNAYVTGTTHSGDYPTTAEAYMAQPPTPQQSSFLVFVTKLNATGTALLYSTLLGGTDADVGYGIAVNTLGEAAVTGWTESVNFPVRNAIYTGSASLGLSVPDAFITKFNAAGSALRFSTYVGGSDWEWGAAIAVDGNGDISVVGGTGSADFLPLANSYQSGLSGLQDAFVTKLDATGSLLMSTYLGGSGKDAGYGIAIMGACDIQVLGTTNSPDFPFAGPAYQPTPAGGWDVFTTRLHESGVLLHSTYIGGSSNDFGLAVAVHGETVYGTGSTLVPTGWSGLQRHFPTGWGGDALVVKLSPPVPNLPLSVFSVPASVAFDASDYTASEQQGNVTITVERHGAFLPVAAVHYTTVAGTATPGVDYLHSIGVLGFLAGETSQTFSVPILPDVEIEPDETVGLVLSDPECRLPLGPQQTAILTITEPGVTP